MIVQTIVQICAKYVTSRLKIGGVMAISFVAMATATLRKEFVLYIFLVLLSTVSAHYVCFLEKLRESFNRKR